MTKKKKTVLITVLVLIVVLIASSILYVLYAFGILHGKASWFTMEEHIQKITEAAENYLAKYNKNFEYTELNVYPLYNENDQFEYCLLEFAPSGFMFVQIDDRGYFYTEKYVSRQKQEDGTVDVRPWQRYRVCIDGQEPEPYNGVQWLANEDDYSYRNRRYEVDLDGKFIKHTNSPYKIHGVLEQRMYLLSTYQHDGYIPAIKLNGEFFNLVSLQEFEFDNSYMDKRDDIPELSFGFIFGDMFRMW